MTCTTLSDGDVNVLDDIQVVDDVHVQHFQMVMSMCWMTSKLLMTCTTLGDVNVLDDIQVVDDVYNTW